MGHIYTRRENIHTHEIKYVKKKENHFLIREARREKSEQSWASSISLKWQKVTEDLLQCWAIDYVN